MRTVSVTIAALCILWVFEVGAQADGVSAARELIGRVLPEKAALFEVEALPEENGRDVFEIESRDGKIILGGSSGVAVASALNWYLKHYCNCSVSWRGRQTTLPDPLPVVSPKLRLSTPFQWRYCFNYCCFSYSMAWWDWAEWEKIIDWMALNGINMPLAVTGQESVWREVGLTFGLDKAEMDRFFVGSAYLPFGWMGCMDGWGGPLPGDWISKHADLQRRIVTRERELGMKPVLQGFTGHVPGALKEKRPQARFQQLPSWCGFPGTLFVDPGDPLFVEIGKAFIEEQTRQFGTDHLYASDTFIEMSPPSNDPAFLDAMGKAVFEAMRAGDPEALWIMQGWLFVNNPDFWQPPQAKALLTSVPDDRMTVLDLYCESRPAWSTTESFYGKPWIWCIIQDFGDVVSMHGGLPQITTGLSDAVLSPDRGKLCGAGFIMEGLGYNPVVQDLVSEMFWNPEKRDMSSWVTNYARQRYGKNIPKVTRAWAGLLKTVYRQPGRGNSIVCKRPYLSPRETWGETARPYSVAELMEAWKDLVACADELQSLDTYQYDLVLVTQQVLSDYACISHKRIMEAYAAGNLEAFREETSLFLRLMEDLDALLATRQEFLLGKWIEDAKRWGANEEEKALLEWNARTQITLWGPADGVLHDYAQKHWAGLVRDFYRTRWEKFFNALATAMEGDTPFNPEEFEKGIQAWEEGWTKQGNAYSPNPSGNVVNTVRAIQAFWGGKGGSR